MASAEGSDGRSGGDGAEGVTTCPGCSQDVMPEPVGPGDVRCPDCGYEWAS